MHKQNKSDRVNWGKVRTFQIPNFVIEFTTSGYRPMPPAMLSVYLAILQKRKQIGPNYTNKKLSESTIQNSIGLSRDTVRLALKGLEQKGLTQCTRMLRNKGSRFGANEYSLRHSDTGAILDNPQPKKSLFHKTDIPYFKMPQALVTEPDRTWALANLSGSQIALYTAILWKANRQRKNKFKSTELQALSSLSKNTFLKTLSKIEDLGLICRESETIEICDPYTGSPIENDFDEKDPANYYETSTGRRYNFNGPMSPEQLEEFLAEYLPQKAVRQHGDQFYISCPFHSDKRTLSCGINTSLRCYHCFGCGAKGHLDQFLMRVLNLSKAEFLQWEARAAVVG